MGKKTEKINILKQKKQRNRDDKYRSFRKSNWQGYFRKNVAKNSNQSNNTTNDKYQGNVMMPEKNNTLVENSLF